MSLAVKTQANPAPATEFTVTVPGDKYWVVRALRFVLQTDATVATRTCRIALDDGTTTVFVSFNDVGQSASITSDYSLAPGAGQSAASVASSTARVSSIPPIVLPPGSRIRSVTTNKQAADQFSAIALLVEETSSDPTRIVWARGGEFVQ
jgi:hypothetical protein